jgi:hypothetical protein
MLGHLQVITINNIKEKTYTHLISGGLVCVAGVEFQLGMQSICLCLETLMWLSMDVFLFLVLLNGAVLVGVLCLIVWGVCVCVCVAMRAEWAGLLLPGGREGKIYSCESVCVLVGMI